MAQDLYQVGIDERNDKGHVNVAQGASQPVRQRPARLGAAEQPPAQADGR